MARISGVDLPREKRVEIALTYIYGIGRKTASDIIAATGVNPDIRVKDLSEDDVSKLREYIDHHCKVEGDLRRETAFDIKRLVEIGCYRGVRHRKGLPVRGQRSKTNCPKRDIVKELRAAILAEGLHFGLSSHRAENCWFFSEGMKIPSDVQDTTITLYGERIQEPDGPTLSREVVHQDGSNEHSRRDWLTHMYEIIDQYQPELLYFDWTVGKDPFQETFYKFMAYYYNNAIDWNKGVVVNTKFGYGDNIQVFDIERGKSDQIRPYPWQTDTSIGKVFWFHHKDESDLKSVNHLIDDLVDIVSKNGNLLLNVGPRADGTIPESQQKVLREIGHWLQVNGEAIYETRLWIKSGEGPNKGTAGYMTDSEQSVYTSKDIRFTTRKDTLYATVLSWTDGFVTIESLSEDVKPVHSVSMLGCDEQLDWIQNKSGLTVKFPEEKPTDYAHVLKIQ